MDKIAINKRFREVVDYIISSKITTKKTDLAENLGIKYGILAEILAGRMNASVEVIASLCDFYNISTEYLLFGRGEMLCTHNIQHTSKRSTQSAESQGKDDTQTPTARSSALETSSINDNITCLISILDDTLKEKDKQIDRLLSIIEKFGE